MRRSQADSTNRSLAAFGKLQHIHSESSVVLGRLPNTRAAVVSSVLGTRSWRGRWRRVAAPCGRDRRVVGGGLAAPTRMTGAHSTA